MKILIDSMNHAALQALKALLSTVKLAIKFQVSCTGT
jgi:hypothetical protein